MEIENIEQLLKSIGSADVPPDVRQIAEEAAESFGRTLQPPRRHFLLGDIVRTRIVKYAAAAVIIIAAVLGIYTFAGGGASRALADLIDNAKKMPWLHIVMDVRPVGTHGEYWFCFDSLIEVHNEKDAISYIDFAKREKQVYDPQANAITVSYLARGNFLHDAPGAESPWTFLGKLIEKMKNEGGKVSKLKGEYQGSAADIYKVTLPRKAHKGPTVIKIIADPGTNLPVAYHQETPYRHPDNEEVLGVKTCELSFDFPDKGPQNLYELGVPESAQVVNNLPDPNAIAILNSYKARRDAFFQQRFLAVVALSREPDEVFSGAWVIYNDPCLLRIDYYKVEERFNPDGNWPESKSELGSTATSVLQWLRMSGFATLRQSELFDGKHRFERTLIREHSQQWQWSSHKNSARSKGNNDIMANCLPLLDHWLSKSISVTIVEDDYSKDEALTCIQLLGPQSEYGLLSPRKCLIYLHPQKDYHWRRLEIEYKSKAEPGDSTKVSIREVKEFSQTEEGWVYPRVIEEWDRGNDSSSASTIRTVYLQMNPAFPKGIFLPENLPQ